jgi:hypothetical protein
MATEVWKQVPEYPAYDVSNMGRVRSYYYRNKGEIADQPQRFLKPSPNAKGYLCVGLSRNGHSKIYTIHSLVLLAFVGARPDGMLACHNDSNQTNNHLDNLRYDTPKGNMNDRIPGTWFFNQLNEKQVREVRYKRAAGATLSELAKEYGISSTSISLISRGISHASFGGPLTFGVAPGRQAGRKCKQK